MRLRALHTYFDMTYWREASLVPSFNELRDMESQCFDELVKVKEQDEEQFKVVYERYFDKTIGRISSCIRRIEDRTTHDDEVAIIRLLSSHNRLLSTIKRVERGGYGTPRDTAQQDKPTPSDIRKPVVEHQPPQQPNPFTSSPFMSSTSRYVTHFTSLNINEEKAAILYDRLVQDGYLEDRSKSDFIFYYTGKGRKPVYQLKWRGDDILLSVLMEQLSPKGGRISWQVLGKIYEGLNTDSMKNVLSKTKKGEEVSTYDKHKKTAEEWLK